MRWKFKATFRGIEILSMRQSVTKSETIGNQEMRQSVRNMIQSVTKINEGLELKDALLIDNRINLQHLRNSPAKNLCADSSAGRAGDS